MPVHPVKGQPGCYQWGESGKVYCGPNAKEKAEAQGRAIYASGYTGKAEMEMPALSKIFQEDDERWWLYHTWKIKADDFDTIFTYQSEGSFQIWVLMNPYQLANRGGVFGSNKIGTLTFICTDKNGNAKQECGDWMVANLPSQEWRRRREASANEGKYYSIVFEGLTYAEDLFARRKIEAFARNIGQKKFKSEGAERYVAWQTPTLSAFGYRLSKHHITQDGKLTLCGREIGYDSYISSQKPNNLCKRCEKIDMRAESFETKNAESNTKP